MSATATGRRGLGPSRLDPTVRALLRAFLSPAVADRYASALQPIAVADRDAALAGAVSTLRARFYVLPEELAVALVEDAGWAVADVSTMLGLPTMEVRAALRAAAGDAAPRIRATPPEDLDLDDDEAAAVEALLADQPTRRRDAAAAAEEPDDTEQVDVELSTTIPAHIGRPVLEAQFRRSDRLQRLVVNSTIALVLLLMAATLNATRPAVDDIELPELDEVDVDTPSPGPTPTTTTTTPATPATPTTTPPSPTATPPPAPTTGPLPADDLPVGPPVLDAARFVASVDPATGEPGPTLDEATPEDDPRLWLRLSQMPQQELVMQLTFTAPSGRSTVRPVLITDRTPLVSVRLPDELGRTPGRYAVRIDAEGLEPEVVELVLEVPQESP